MIQEYTIQNEEIKVTAINYGAAITGIYTKDKDGHFENIVANYEDLEQYSQDKDTYLNAVVGPISGRIQYGKCENLHLSINNGNHHLHGGYNSIAYQKFDCKIEENSLLFTLKTTHEMDGYPEGFVLYKIKYTIVKNQLIIDLKATPPKHYPLFMTTHTYFNLSGDLKRDILSQEICIPSNHRVCIHKDGHPYKIEKIKKQGTFDFNTSRSFKDAFCVDEEEFRWTLGYDCSFVLKTGELELYDPISGRRMNMYTTAPSVVMYTSNYFKDDLCFKNHIHGRQFLTVALEPQEIPNGMNIEQVCKDRYYHNKDNPFIQQTIYTFYTK